MFYTKNTQKILYRCCDSKHFWIKPYHSSIEKNLDKETGIRIHLKDLIKYKNKLHVLLESVREIQITSLLTKKNCLNFIQMNKDVPRDVWAVFSWGERVTAEDFEYLKKSRVKGVIVSKSATLNLNSKTIRELYLYKSYAVKNNLLFGIEAFYEWPDLLRLIPFKLDRLGLFDKQKNLIETKNINKILWPKSLNLTGADYINLFVSDFVIKSETGMYSHEVGSKQRLLFNIVAKTVAANKKNIHQIVSYDIIVDAIRIALLVGHHYSLEEIAETLSAWIFNHPHVLELTINISKLDIIGGKIGIEIHKISPYVQTTI